MKNHLRVVFCFPGFGKKFGKKKAATAGICLQNDPNTFRHQ
jgi:hypothetical protein